MGALCALKCFNISVIIHATKVEKEEVGTTTLLYHMKKNVFNTNIWDMNEFVLFYFSMLLYTKYLDSCGVVGVTTFKKHFSSKGFLIGICNYSCFHYIRMKNNIEKYTTF